MHEQASMLVRAGGTLPFSGEQVFDLAADIERYPQFLTGWISSRIQKREGNVCHVEQVVGFGPVRLQFASQAVLHRPHRIDVTSTDPPFRKYSLTWLVADMPTGGCRISVAAELELRSGLLQRIVNCWLPTTIEDVVAAFEARAHSIYAEPKGRGQGQADGAAQSGLLHAALPKS
jgi:coenzyme Q-binding protein COQ10